MNKLLFIWNSQWRKISIIKFLHNLRAFFIRFPMFRFSGRCGNSARFFLLPRCCCCCVHCWCCRQRSCYLLFTRCTHEHNLFVCVFSCSLTLFSLSHCIVCPFNCYFSHSGYGSLFDLTVGPMIHSHLLVFNGIPFTVYTMGRSPYMHYRRRENPVFIHPVDHHFRQHFSVAIFAHIPPHPRSAWYVQFMQIPAVMILCTPLFPYSAATLHTHKTISIFAKIAWAGCERYRRWPVRLPECKPKRICEISLYLYVRGLCTCEQWT